METGPPLVVRATRRSSRFLLSYFKTLSIDLVSGIEPVTSRSAVERSTNWTSPVAVVINISCYVLFIRTRFVLCLGGHTWTRRDETRSCPAIQQLHGRVSFCYHIRRSFWSAEHGGRLAVLFELFTHAMILEILRFLDDDDHENLYPLQSIARAWASVILAGKRDSRCR